MNQHSADKTFSEGLTYDPPAGLEASNVNDTESHHDYLPHSNARDWSISWKRFTLSIICFLAFLPDYTSATGIVTIIPQAREWHKSPYAVQQTVSANIAALGLSNLVAVVLSKYFGRLPVVFFLQLFSVATIIWCAMSPNYAHFLAARITNGLVASAAQGAGLMWIRDMFTADQEARNINMLEFPIILSPYLGPLVASFVIDQQSWRVPFWICTGLFALGLLLVAMVLDETMPMVSAGHRKPRSSVQERLLELFGVRQIVTSRREGRTIKRGFEETLSILRELPVLLCVVFYFLNFAWVISVNTTISIWLTEFYAFGPRKYGFFSFFGIVGVSLGWFLGHYMHDFVSQWQVGRKAVATGPEARLLIIYPASLLMFTSLVVIGFALEGRWHFMTLAVPAASQCGAIMIMTTAVNAYLFEKYPGSVGDTGTWLANGRIFGGFMATYIQIPWVERIGAAATFGVQAAITAFSISL
ncbi:Hypothetical protein D9617_53g017780 [Elsinoe fawcettii]|nr:Hypothetical protein D9617_53g017780 [Elsinoe fawcettii]